MSGRPQTRRHTAAAGKGRSWLWFDLLRATWTESEAWRGICLRVCVYVWVCCVFVCMCSASKETTASAPFEYLNGVANARSLNITCVRAFVFVCVFARMHVCFVITFWFCLFVFSNCICFVLFFKWLSTFNIWFIFCRYMSSLNNWCQMVIIWKFSHAEITSAIIGSLLATNCNFYNKKREKINVILHLYYLFGSMSVHWSVCCVCIWLSMPLQQKKKKRGTKI